MRAYTYIIERFLGQEQSPRIELLRGETEREGSARQGKKANDDHAYGHRVGSQSHQAAVLLPICFALLPFATALP